MVTKNPVENLQQKFLRDPGKTPEMMNLSRESSSSTSPSLSTAVILLFGENILYSTQCWWKTKLQNTIIDVKKSIIGGIQPFVTLRWKKKKCGSWNPSKDLGWQWNLICVPYPSGQITIIPMGWIDGDFLAFQTSSKIQWVAKSKSYKNKDGIWTENGILIISN